VSELGFEMGDSGESKNESAGTGNSALQHAAAKIVPATLFFIFKFIRFFFFSTHAVSPPPRPHARNSDVDNRT
jgi:hypothetical protein